MTKQNVHNQPDPRLPSMSSKSKLENELQPYSLGAVCAADRAAGSSHILINVAKSKGPVIPTPRQEAEARQSRLDEDCRLDRKDRRNIQVRSSNGEEEVA